MFGNPKSLWPSKVFCLIASLMCFVGLAHGEPYPGGQSQKPSLPDE